MLLARSISDVLFPRFLDPFSILCVFLVFPPKQLVFPSKRRGCHAGPAVYGGLRRVFPGCFVV